MEAEVKKNCISRQIENDACLKGKPYTAKYKAASKNAAIEHDMHSHVK